ncbi:MAG: hypothetical protein HKN94_00900 [Acidimicrobiales bacterium]|nr:hypothetical protein [Acidimicrobiales bacterium]RZV47795.1 MAG: hypothetical protein EX269_04085 [Acidimicrobiales bacterium]
MNLSSLDVAFDDALKELASSRIAYEEDPRDPQRIERLGRARVKLDESRRAMRTERERLGLEGDVVVDRLIERADLEPMPQWQGLPSD